MTNTVRQPGTEGSRVGRVLGGRYVVGRLLGSGGMSNVYRARDRVTGTEVAVKIFRPELDLIDAHRRRQHEVDVLRSLRHDGLVAVLDAETRDEPAHGADRLEEHEPGGEAYLVVELVDGPTLRQALRAGPMGETQVAALGASLCDAVGYMHGRGIVHRDIKPANILLATPDDAHDLTPKLTDFGLARVVDSTRMTSEGLVLGTANYLSPEQVTGSGAGTASDIFSLSLVLIEALTGEVVYPGFGVEAAVVRLHRPPTIPTEIRPAFAELLTRMSAGDPQQRPSAVDVGAELAMLADPSLDSDLFTFDAARSSASTGRIRPPRAEGRARLRFGVLAVAAAVVAGVMTSGAVLFGHDDANAGAQAAARPSSPSTAGANAATRHPTVSPPSSTGAASAGRASSGSRRAVAAADGKPRRAMPVEEANSGLRLPAAPTHASVAHRTSGSKSRSAASHPAASRSVASRSVASHSVAKKQNKPKRTAPRKRHPQPKPPAPRKRAVRPPTPVS